MRYTKEQLIKIKEQERALAQKMDALVDEIKKQLPEGWIANRCFGLSLTTTNFTPEYVSISRVPESYKDMMEARRTMTPEQKKETQKKWFDEGKKIAGEIVAKLRKLGHNAHPYYSEAIVKPSFKS